MGKNGLLNIYSWLLANYLNNGAFARAGRLQSTSIDPQYNYIFTKTHVKQVYKVTGIKPDNIDIDFISYLRDRMFEQNPDVEMDFTVLNIPVQFSVTDDKFSRQFSKSADAYATYKEAFDSQKGIARLTGKTYRLPGGGRLRLSRERLDDLYQVFISYKSLFEQVSTGGSMCLANVFIELSGKDIRSVRRAGQDIYGLLGQLNIGCETVKSANRSFLMEIGAAVGPPKTLNKKFLPQLLFTDRNMAAFTPYKSRGLVGGGKGALLLGMDFRSRLPFSVDIFRAGSAQVFMLLGKTGSGKTYTAFQIALSALALGCYVSAIDIKGREWVQISDLAKTKMITFDDRHPSFVNTLRLDDLHVDDLTDATEMYNTAVNGTVQLFLLIVNLQEGEGNVADAELVLREAVMKMYSNIHVDPLNPESFKVTRFMRYSDVLPVLESLATTATYTEEQKHMVHLSRSRLHAYLGESGILSEAFRNEVTLADVLDSPLVIYELNKNQNMGSMSDSLDVIRIFMIQFLDSKKKSMLKRQGKFLFAFYEELQRTAQFGNLLEYICHDVTGSRSNNAVIVLLLNSLKVLQGKEGQDIRSNITSMLVGLVEDNDINTIREDFGRPWLAHQLKLFSSKQSVYRNCFAAEVDPGIGSVLQTVFKVEIPVELSRRFRTRTIKED